MNVDNIDKVRLFKFSDKYPLVTAGDVYTYLFRTSQSTLYQLFRHSRKPIESEVITGAAVLFSKFFSLESVLDFKPHAVLVACVNLATKTEEYHTVSLSDLVSGLSDASELKQTVPRIEMKLLACCHYDLVFEQPWPVVLYWVDELKVDFPEEVCAKLYDNACEILRVWLWTDAILIFPTTQLATAATFKACMNVAQTEDKEELVSAFSKLFSHTLNVAYELRILLQSIERVVLRFGTPEQVLKDPSREQTHGYLQLMEFVNSSI